MTQQTWLEGAISIEAVLQGRSRDIERVYIQQGKWNRTQARLLQELKRAGISVEKVTAEFIEEKAGGKSHGGIIAMAGPRRFVSLAEMVADTAVPFIVMLDGFEDPFNFGQAVRALYAAGVGGIVVRPRNWLSATNVVARSSAGASELVPMAVAETAVAAADFFREQGLVVACTAVTGSQPVDKVDLTMPLFLLIGGEKRGITRSFMDQADLRLQIPYGRQFQHSLGAAASAAIIGYEIMRQRR
ncbi:MAG: RNA methyltransferase [Ardenticatenaceae bacterium]|nr:RNA methyltransferase [Ardenticatenaceae bacterium]